MKQISLITTILLIFLIGCVSAGSPPAYNPNADLNIRSVEPPPARVERAPKRIPEYTPEPYHHKPKDYQTSLCSVVVINKTPETWSVSVNGSDKGLLNPWSRAEFSSSCIAVSLELHSNFPNFRVMNKHFYPHEKSGNKYIWRLRVK